MSISVIIPTLNEAAALPGLLKALDRDDKLTEIIVVDGGSVDDTANIALRHGVQVFIGECGRGQQIRAGVAQATGDILLFLHADCHLEVGAGRAIEQALANDPDAPGGNFRIIFDGETEFSSWLTGFYAWLRRRGLYYGDSAIFVRRTIYDSIGGVQAIDLMEDYEFARKLERMGTTLNIQNPPVLTSSRRFEGRRAWRIVLQWVLIHALFYLRVSSEELARAYQSRDHRPVRPGRAFKSFSRFQRKTAPHTHRA